jgi:hypothetical protein
VQRTTTDAIAQLVLQLDAQRAIALAIDADQEIETEALGGRHRQDSCMRTPVALQTGICAFAAQG